MIREATEADLDGLVRLSAEVQRVHLDAEPRTYRDASDDEIRSWLRDVLRDADTTTFLYEEDGSLLGYAITRVGHYEDNAYVYGRSWVYVDQVGVTRAARRKGVGRALMDAVQAHADALDVDAVQLDVRAFNDGARAFYEALGYAPSKIAMRRSRR